MIYKVKKIKGGKLMLLHLTDCLQFAKNYAVEWSNENDCSCLIYGKSDLKALFFTHRMSANNYQLFK